MSLMPAYAAGPENKESQNKNSHNKFMNRIISRVPESAIE